MAEATQFCGIEFYALEVQAEHIWACKGLCRPQVGHIVVLPYSVRKAIGELNAAWVVDFVVIQYDDAGNFPITEYLKVGLKQYEGKQAKGL